MLAFVEGQQNLANKLGEKQYLEELKKAKSNGPNAALRPAYGLPRNSSIGWMRISLSKPVPKDKIDEISRTLGVIVRYEDSLRFVVRGKKEAVKKAVEMIYQLQLIKVSAT